MTYQRMYQPKVKTGNWFEDLLIKEVCGKENEDILSELAVTSTYF